MLGPALGWVEPGSRPPWSPSVPPGPAPYLQPGANSGALGLPEALGAPEEEEDEQGFLQPRVVQPNSAELDKSGIKPTREI